MSTTRTILLLGDSWAEAMADRFIILHTGSVINITHAADTQHWIDTWSVNTDDPGVHGPISSLLNPGTIVALCTGGVELFDDTETDATLSVIVSELYDLALAVAGVDIIHMGYNVTIPTVNQSLLEGFQLPTPPYPVGLTNHNTFGGMDPLGRPWTGPHGPYIERVEWFEFGERDVDRTLLLPDGFHLPLQEYDDRVDYLFEQSRFLNGP
jgi:hypothetical protein